ncbi:KICSTOR complex protein SZT2-like isoform X3 [Homarus americanus]|uniref:KICSTOR complex protein SZT2-like isoform X3 n=1 Tax=Homarus americanus TaxID=6706 RepID=UPI001C490C88|nr:KICSTOR complex protein SZT2-like isoform X3 [Homarus americanus]
MTTVNEPRSTDEEGVEALEAEHVYILMKKEYRISRNVRAEWYLRRINSIITFPRREKLSDNEEELEVVSVIPLDIPMEWDYDTSHLYKYRITQRTTLHFLSRKYRLVFCLDLSPSTSIVDVTKGRVVLDEVFTTLRQCLKGIVRPFYVPGSQLLFQPEVYLTIIAHTPFFKSQSQQVLVQGWLLMVRNLDEFLNSIQIKLSKLETQLAEATAQTYGQMDFTREKSELGQKMTEEAIILGPTTLTNPMVSPDIGFVDMLRYGIVALQLLPENSSAGVVVITDGVISLPDATVFDSLLVQLRNQTIACSFLQLGSVYYPHASLGYVPFSDLMNFLATATCGAYLATLPPIGDDYDYHMNEYHKSLLSWGFQKFMHGLSVDTGYEGISGFYSLLPVAQEATQLMRKKERENQLNTTLNAVLSCRLREGYAIKQVTIAEDHIQLVLVLPWKYSIFIEYHIRSAWPPTQSSLNTVVWIEATYEFLNDVTSDVHRQFRSKYRQSMVAKYWSTLQHLRDTDMLLVGLQSFASNPTYFKIPDCIKRGHPVFYRNPGHINSISDATSDQFPQFTTFWKPVCMLDSNIWQKWMHTHRIGVILEHDHPLPKNLHVTNTSGRYGIVHCRQAESALTALLAEWCDFILIENDSYIKFLYNEGDGEEQPISFFMVRITSKPPPCLVIRLAFLGGTPGHVRNQLVGHISERIQGLTFPSRVGLTERSKSLPPAIHQSQDKLGDDMTLSASSAMRASVVRPLLTRVASNIPCCVITHKPIEKILIWYDKMPSNLLNIVPETPNSSSTRSVYHKLGATKSATHNMALLSRYLHHRRWIWAVQAPCAPAVSLNAVARILNTLSRIRLQEGFNFAYSCNGIITMVREFDMKLELNESDGEGLMETCSEGGLATFPCVAQYVIFPPHITNCSRDSIVDEDWEEGDSVEADGEMQIVTECWVEPQNGVVTSPSPHAAHLHDCNYRQLAQAFFPVDQKCIWGLLTVEHLLLMCQGSGTDGMEARGFADTHYSFDEPNTDPSLRIMQIPFSFDLIGLLPMCQQVELLVSTYIQDLFTSLVKRVTFDCEASVDEANQILYDLLLDHLCQLHHDREFHLSTADLEALPTMLQQRQRPPTAKASPFVNTNISKMSDPPKWRCFLKGVSTNHLLITLVPASYHDLKLLLVKRANITETNNMALKLVPNSENVFDLDTETNTTDQPPTGLMSEQLVSLESSTSSLTHMTSPSLPPPTPTNSRSATMSVDEVGERTPSRVRYKSGPVSQTTSQQVQSVFFDSVLRERASSFHVSRERCSSFGQGGAGAERNRTGSVDSPTKEPQYDVPKITSPNEQVKRRYISMPSKSYTGMFDPTTKSMSPEGLRNEDGCVPLHLHAGVGGTGETDSVQRVSSLDESTSAMQPPPSHKPMYGAVTLPIYVYDCKLSSIITQLINSSDNRSGVVGKDIYMDSTSKFECEIVEDTVPLKDDSITITTSLQEDLKQPSPEPRSEESDVGADTSYLRAHVDALEVLYLRSFVLGVFQALQRELNIQAHDMQIALDLCHEAVMEIEITNFIQTICGHLRDFRLRIDLEHMHQCRPEASVPKSDSSPHRTSSDKVEKKESTGPTRVALAMKTSCSSHNRFPLSLLKLHHPCRDLQQLHSSIRERFLTILQGSFHPVPSLPDYYFFSPQTLRRSSEGTPVGDFFYVSSQELERWEKNQLDLTRQRKLRRVSVSKKSDVFTEGEEDLDDENTVNGGEEEEEEDDDDDDHDKSIEFRSEIGSTVFQRLHSQLTAFDGDEDKTSVISERDEDLSTLPDNLDLADGPIPPLFLHFTCTVRLAGHVQSIIPMKTVPTCLDEIVESLRSSEVDLSQVSVTLDVLCMTLLPALASKTAGESGASLMDLRSARTTSFCSTASSQNKRARSLSESTCASLSDMDESFLEDEDQLGHLPDYQHQAIVATVDDIKWLLRDEIASAMLHMYPLAEQTLDMVATHVESSRQARNCISESIPLNFVCGMEQSRDKFMQEFGRMSVSGHHLKQEGSLYYLVQDKTQMRRRPFSSLVPPLGFKNQFLIVRPQPHADDIAQLRQMDSGCQVNKVSLSSPDAIISPPNRLQPTRVSFDAERNLSESLVEGENNVQRVEGSEKEKWVRRRERKERRDSERRGSINTSDSDTDIKQVRSHFSRESSHQSHDGRVRSSESPKKSTTLTAALSANKSSEGCEGEEEADEEEDREEDNCGTVKEYPDLSQGSPPEASTTHTKESVDTVDNRELGEEDSHKMPEPFLEHMDPEEADHGLLVRVTSLYSGANIAEDKTIETKDSLENQLKGKSTLPQTSPINFERPEISQNQDKFSNESQTPKVCGDARPLDPSHTEPFSTREENIMEGHTPLYTPSKVLTFDEGTEPLLEMQKPVKDAPHRLSLPLNELIRCGSESFPRPPLSAEVIRKSASTDNFVPCVTDASVEQLRATPSCTMTTSGSSCGLWAEFIKSRHNSSEVMKSRNSSGTSADLLKSRHNSGTGGDILKSRHNSGTGSVPGGPYSDVSSLLESGQTTEDGCEGDISDSDNDCCDWLQDFESVRPFLPEFWLILRVSSDRVDTFFHCRTETEMARWCEVQTEVVRSVRSLVKLVNQTLLLQDLHNTRMCNLLLEPETSDDIWRHEDTKGRGVDDSDAECRGYLEAAFKFKPGAFACRVVWETKFELHPKVKCTAGKVGSKGILALRTILNPFSVNNRKNMFVYEDSSGNGSNVFYLRLKEHQSTSVSPQVEGRRDETGLSRSSSVVSLGKRGSRDDDPLSLKAVGASQHYELRPRVSSFGEKDVIMEGVPSTPAQRKHNHCIILTVHGIAEPGPAIKEELVRMLQNRLDEAVVEAICVMLWSNPQHKLTPEIVHFIQPPYQPPKTILRFTVSAHAHRHLQAVGYYLRQNMLSCGFIHPKFADNCLEHHFQDFSATDQDLSSEPNIFLYVRPRKSAAKGIACIAFSLVDGSGCIVQHISCPRPSQDAYMEVFSRQDFEVLTYTQEYQPSPTKSPGPMAMLQFKVWESGRVDLDEVRRYLMDSTRHALWDVNTEYRLLTAPVMPPQPVQQHTTPASEPSTPKKETRGPTMRSVSLLETGTQPAEDRMRSVSISGVPPHVCLPRIANKFGSKRMVRPSEGRGEGQRERAPSPLTLVQARLRLMSNSVPDLKLRGRRASLQSPWDNTTGSDGVPTNVGHSPLKVRHSVDLGMERSKLLGEDGHLSSHESQPWEYQENTCHTLHPIFHGLMLEWLEYASELDERGEHAVRRELGEKGGEHAVKKHTVHITTRHAVPIFISELQKWVSHHSSDTSTKIFEETVSEGESSVYKLVESSKVPQVLRCDPKGGYVDSNFIIIGRNNQQWWATLFEENFNDYYINMITSSKNSQRYHPLVVSPRGRCVSGGEATYPRLESNTTMSALNTPNTVPTTGPTSSAPTISGMTSSAVSISSPVTVPSTPTSMSNAVGPLWTYDTSDVLFIPRQKLLLATLCGLELVIYTYNWTKEQCDNLHSTMTHLSHWSTARNRLLSTIVLQKMGLFHNQPFVRKSSDKKEEAKNPYISSPAYVDGLIKLQAPVHTITDRGTRRVQGMVPAPSLTEIYRDNRPPRSLKNSQYGNLKDLELRHGSQMTEIKRLIVQKAQRKVLLKTVVQTHGHSSPAFNDKILALYKQNARIAHFCYTPLLFLPRWRWQVSAARDHSLADTQPPIDKTTLFGLKTPEPRSRHDSGSSIIGLSCSGPTDLRRSLSFKPSVPSPSQRRRHVTGGDEKWHDALCSSYLKEYIQYLQSLGFLSLNVTQAPQQRGRSISREPDNRGFRVKEVRFSEQVTKEPTYLLKNVLGGTILLEIIFSEPYFSAKLYILESCRLEGKKLFSQIEEVSKVVVGGPPSSMPPSPHSPAPSIFPEGCPPDQIDDKFAINSFLDKVDDIKVLLHMHSFTYDFHLRALCAYVAGRQLLFTPGYHLSSCLSDFIKYYNKGPNFARNLIHTGKLTIEDTGTPGEQLYNYLLAREKQYRMRVLRMTPVIHDPDALMQYTEFILVHTKTCRVHYKDGNDQRVSDEYDVTLLVSHNTSADIELESLHPNILHLNFYVILTSTREVYPNRILEKKMGRFRTVSTAPFVGKHWTSSSTHPDGSDQSGSATPPAAAAEENPQQTPSAGNDVPPPPVKSYIGIRSESVNYLGYYTVYEETMQRTLEAQAEEARTRIHHIFNQAKIHCRRDSLWQRLTASLREEERQKLSREQVLGGLSFIELSELLTLVRVEPLSSVDPQLLPLLSKPLLWYQGLTRVLQSKYQERHRSLTSSDGNIQHVVVLSSTCPDAFMMLSINLHHQKAELCCVNKQLKGEGTVQKFSDSRIQALIQDFVNACCFHLWCGLL